MRASLTWRNSTASVCCSILLITHLVCMCWSYLYPLVLYWHLESHALGLSSGLQDSVPHVFTAAWSLMRLLYTFSLCVPVCHGAIIHTHTHTLTHMGLVKPHPNPERLDSRGRSLGLGPLQLATGSHDSNNWVASQLQGTVMLFSPKEPDWRKMNNYGLRDWMNDYSSAVF